MAEIAKAGTPSLAHELLPACNRITGLYVGENIAAGDLAYVKAGDNKIYRASGAGAGVAAPDNPAVTTATTGGTVLAGTYGVAVSYTTASGETVTSGQTFVTTTGSTSTITVASPPAATGAVNYKVYMTTAGGAVLALQNGAGTAVGTNYTLTAPPGTTGAAPMTNRQLFAAASVRGVAMTPGYVAQSDAVTLGFGATFQYGSGLTPGADVYLSGTVPGGIADAPSAAGIAPVGYCVDTTRIYFFHPR